MNSRIPWFPARDVGTLSGNLRFPAGFQMVSITGLGSFLAVSSAVSKRESSFQVSACTGARMETVSPAVSDHRGGRSFPPSRRMRPSPSAFFAHLLMVPLGLPNNSATSVTVSTPSRTC